MKINSIFRATLAVAIASFLSFFLTTCGNPAPSFNEEILADEAEEAAGVVDDDNDDETTTVDLNKELIPLNVEIDGASFMFGGIPLEIESGESTDVTISFLLTATPPSPTPPLAGFVLFEGYDYADDSLVFSSAVPFDFSTEGEYSVSFTVPPLAEGNYYLNVAGFKEVSGSGSSCGDLGLSSCDEIFAPEICATVGADTCFDWFGSFATDFNVIGGTPGGPDPIDLASDCASGQFNLAGVHLTLVDDGCDGLLEQYKCNDGPFVNISHGATYLDCGLRIANGTPVGDKRNFRWTDTSTGGGVAIPTVFAGGPGDDIATGSAADDLLLGAAGHDHFNGREGNDTISGGSTHGHLDGEAGNDRIYGGADYDWVAGKGGNDELYGGGGNDFINGYEGDDLLDGGAGDDAVYGGSGNDLLNCGDGDDICKGSGGADLINAGPGTDYCSGGSGNDTIDCGSGEDLINARGGDDTIEACDDEVDVINGGPGLNLCSIDVNPATMWPEDDVQNCAAVDPCF